MGLNIRYNEPNNKSFVRWKLKKKENPDLINGDLASCNW